MKCLCPRLILFRKATKPAHKIILRIPSQNQVLFPAQFFSTIVPKQLLQSSESNETVKSAEYNVIKHQLPSETDHKIYSYAHDVLENEIFESAEEKIAVFVWFWCFFLISSPKVVDKLRRLMKWPKIKVDHYTARIIRCRLLLQFYFLNSYGDAYFCFERNPWLKRDRENMKSSLHLMQWRTQLSRANRMHFIILQVSDNFIVFSLKV